MSTAPTIPQRFSETAFRRYEGVIRMTLNAYPQPSVFDPSPLSSETFSHRLRDAMTSLLLYKWTTDIDLDRFAQLRDKLVVRIAPEGHILVCGADQTTVGKPVTRLDDDRTEQTLRVNEPADEVIQALVTLLHHRVLRTTTLTALTPQQEQLLTNLAHSHDFAVADRTQTQLGVSVTLV